MNRRRRQDTPELPERNRPGSPYVEMSLDDDSSVHKIGVYYVDLVRRNAKWHKEHDGFAAPETLPYKTDLEMELLQRLVGSEGGTVNFWDVSTDLRVGGSNYDEACLSFVGNLGLEVKRR